MEISESKRGGFRMAKFRKALHISEPAAGPAEALLIRMSNKHFHSLHASNPSLFRIITWEFDWFIDLPSLGLCSHPTLSASLPATKK